MLGEAYEHMKRARRRKPEERGPKPRPKQRETNDARNALLLLWTQVTVRSQGLVGKRTIAAFHAAEDMILMLNIIINYIVIRLKLVERKNREAFLNQRRGPARGI